MSMIYNIPRSVRSKLPLVRCSAIGSAKKNMNRDQVVCSIYLVDNDNKFLVSRGLKNGESTPVASFIVDVKLDNFNKNADGFEDYRIHFSGTCNAPNASCDYEKPNNEDLSKVLNAFLTRSIPVSHQVASDVQTPTADHNAVTNDEQENNQQINANDDRDIPSQRREAPIQQQSYRSAATSGLRGSVISELRDTIKLQGLLGENTCKEFKTPTFTDPMIASLFPSTFYTVMHNNVELNETACLLLNEKTDIKNHAYFQPNGKLAGTKFVFDSIIIPSITPNQTLQELQNPQYKIEKTCIAKTPTYLSDENDAETSVISFRRLHKERLQTENTILNEVLNPLGYNTSNNTTFNPICHVFHIEKGADLGNDRTACLYFESKLPLNFKLDRNGSVIDFPRNWELHWYDDVKKCVTRNRSASPPPPPPSTRPNIPDGSVSSSSNSLVPPQFSRPS